MARLRAVFTQLQAFWAGLAASRRVVLVLVTLGVLAAVGALAVLGNQQRQSYLFTELSTEDAAAIAQKLQAQQVPFEVDPSGTAIKVPEERVHALRLELASAGLPRGGGVGFEIFDRSQIGATEFEQQISLRRALEGELARSIQTLRGVKSARVHLVMPERRLFASEKESASASVVLKLDGGGFGKREVAAIVHLVSSAVPTLRRDRVSVVSAEGQTLFHSEGGSAGGGGDETTAETARNVALQMETDVRAQLERAVGVGNADVRVHVEVEPSTRERTEERYEPTKTALRSEAKTEEISAGSPELAGGVAGVPGARSNLPDSAEGAPPEAELAGAAATTAGSIVKKTQTRNWEIERVTEKVSTPPGSIRRVSVAVLVNGRWEGAQGENFVPRSKEELATLEESVKRAVGFQADRGDTVHLGAAQFAKVNEEAMSAVKPVVPPWAPWAAVAGLGALAVLGIAWSLLKRRGPRDAAIVPSAPLHAPGVTVFEAARARSVEPLPESHAPSELSGVPDAAALAPAPEPAADFKIRAIEIATRDPASAALVLRRWIATEEPPPAPTPAE